MLILFKNITLTKSGLHKIKYSIEDQKGDAQIKSIVTIILEETDLLPSEPMEDIISKAANIIKREYERR